MQTLTVALGDHSYPIHIGAGLLQRSGELFGSLPSQRVVVVTNPTVAGYHIEVLGSALSAASIHHHVVTVADGEQHKNWPTLYEVHTRLLELGTDRKTTLIALGGGVIGDLAGFAAATYQRGIPLVQMPTTLLAQVDSSVGGKTAINHPLGKNMIGAFYQPRVVISDTATLETLPDRDYLSGIAEVIKCAAVRNLALFEWLEGNMERLVEREPNAVTHAVIQSCRIKAEIIAADERETGQRALLNFGHTFAHAIETATEYETWLHGEAVAVGMMMAAALSQRVTGLSATDVGRVRALIERVPGLARRPPLLEAEHWLALMSRDKKAQEGTLRFVLMTALGRGMVYAGVGLEPLRRVLAEGRE